MKYFSLNFSLLPPPKKKLYVVIIAQVVNKGSCLKIKQYPGKYKINWKDVVHRTFNFNKY